MYIWSMQVSHQTQTHVTSQCELETKACNLTIFDMVTYIDTTLFLVSKECVAYM